MPLYCEVAILSAALCEAHINLALAWGLAMLDMEATFPLIEQAGAIDKWLRAPKLIIQGYDFPADSAEFETLKRLFEERNVLMHPKSGIARGGKKRVAAKLLRARSLAEVLDWLPRFFSLPFDLAEFISKAPQVGGYDFPMLSKRGAIARATVHKHRWGKSK